MIREGYRTGKRIISVGSLPERLMRDIIYMDIKAQWGGINVEVVSNEPFRYQHEGESRVRFENKVQFFEYPANLKETPMSLNHYISNVNQKFLRIGNFLVDLVKRNNAEIRPDGAFKEIESLHNGLEEMLKKIRPHLAD